MTEALQGRRTPKGGLSGIGYVVPSFVILLLILVIPILMGVYYSFTSYSVLGSPRWTGVDNYVRLAHDSSFLRALWITAVYTLIAVPVQTGLSLLIAETVARIFRGRFGSLVRSLLFIPVVASLVVSGIVWRSIFSTDGGVVNDLLGVVGIGPVNFLGEPALALGTVIIVTIWKNVGYFLVIYYAGVMEVPRDLYEASAIDGAGYWRQLWSITLPSLRKITVLVVILGTIWSFQVFDLVYVMTGGGPGGATTPIVMRMYQSGFEDLQMGYASSMAMVLFLIVVVISIVQRKVLSDD